MAWVNTGFAGEACRVKMCDSFNNDEQEAIQDDEENDDDAKKETPLFL